MIAISEGMKISEDDGVIVYIYSADTDFVQIGQILNMIKSPDYPNVRIIKVNPADYN